MSFWVTPLCHACSISIYETLIFFFFLYFVLSAKRAGASVPHLSELNPYVTVKSSHHELSTESDLTFLNTYRCVIVTEAPLDIHLKVNEYCRSQTPPIQVIKKVNQMLEYLYDVQELDMLKGER